MKIKYLFILLITSLLLACPSPASVDDTTNSGILYIGAEVSPGIMTDFTGETLLMRNATVYNNQVGGDSVENASVKMNDIALHHDFIGSYSEDLTGVSAGDTVQLLIEENNKSYSSSVTVPQKIILDTSGMSPTPTIGGIDITHNVNNDLVLKWTMSVDPEEIEIFIGGLSTADGTEYSVTLPGTARIHTISGGTIESPEMFTEVSIISINKSNISGDETHVASSFKATNTFDIGIVNP